MPESGAALAPHAGIPITYVPFRNAHFLSAAVSWAEVIGATAIFIGAVAGGQLRLSGLPPGVLSRVRSGDSRRDAAGDAYRDRDAGHPA